MLRKAFLVIADILKENKVVPRDLILILDKCLGTINILKDITEKENRHIKELAEEIEAFIIVLELVLLFSSESGGPEGKL